VSSTSQTVKTQKGLELQAEVRRDEQSVELVLKGSPTQRLVLHWGLKRPRNQGWSLPPQIAWPAGTVAASHGALQTTFSKTNGRSEVVVRLSPPENFSALEFALFFPDENRWDNNGGRNYQIALIEPSPNPVETLRAQVGAEERLLERAFELPGGGQLATAVTKVEGRYRVRWVCDRTEPLVLHWGLAQRSPQDWALPPENLRGENSSLIQNQAVETPFLVEQRLNQLQLDIAESDAPLGIQFVLREGPQGTFIKCRGGNFYLPVKARAMPPGPAGTVEHSEVAEEIVRAETTHNSWTLMHRFNLCFDLIERLRGSEAGLALVYIYLRFSAIRQLTWQRNYNTKPRELAHAQDRLTQKLAELYRHEPSARPLSRLILATLGRGGDGQRIRDEILNIMHRHHIKEVSGHFLEEWHQKLHNNTTPDDIVICEAYLAFLRDNGNRDTFYRTLEQGGVTRERLQSFERPIRSSPDFVPHLKDALLHDFWNFLRILKASHSGTDLETAIQSARGNLDGGLQGLLNYLWETRNAGADGLLDLVRQTTDARHRLATVMQGSGGLRELLYLDLALEQLLRAAVERNIHLSLNGDQLVDLIAWVLDNLTLSFAEPELGLCFRDWERLRTLPRFGATWSLHAKSVLDRASRALSGWMDHIYSLLQPRAELLGQGFQAEPWTITLFSEEVVRGSSLGFVLSILLRHLDPVLRRAAKIGDWQIISRGQGVGRVEAVQNLGFVQGKRFDGPRIVIADQVTGEEEIPPEITAVIAPDVVDIVSHVAVRARNASVLFASCHNPDVFQQLKALQGRNVRMEISAGGDVKATEAAGELTAKGRTRPALLPTPAPKKFNRFALARSEFDERSVGGKGFRQLQLRNQLPDWVSLPSSAAIPFGVFEKVLDLPINRDVSQRYRGLVEQAGKQGVASLSQLRETVLSLRAPDELKSSLQAAMTASKLAWPQDWDGAWTRIKQVWASKWNERAFLSRQNVGLPHDSLFMSVLVQEVVRADYAFVIHTVNPSNGNPNELFAEVVLGLGETLVGNYPGRALSFVFDKKSSQETLLSFPSKSVGLYGEGLIFRSDSNGEDLPGYAGAGLYDSVLLQPPREIQLDYSKQPIVWDESFRHQTLAKVARLGVEIERALGAPQDIEGAISGADCFVVQTRPQVGLDATG
jgi:alpha-glucan, water dikinase